MNKHPFQRNAITTSLVQMVSNYMVSDLSSSKIKKDELQHPYNAPLGSEPFDYSKTVMDIDPIRMIQRHNNHMIEQSVHSPAQILDLYYPSGCMFTNPVFSVKAIRMPNFNLKRVSDYNPDLSSFELGGAMHTFVYDTGEPLPSIQSMDDPNRGREVMVSDMLIDTSTNKVQISPHATYTEFTRSHLYPTQSDYEKFQIPSPMETMGEEHYGKTFKELQDIEIKRREAALRGEGTATYTHLI